MSLQTRLTALAQAVGADIKLLNGQVATVQNASPVQYGYESLALGSTAIGNTAWKTVPISIGGKMDPPAGAFVENVDGSVTVVNAGWYTVSAVASLTENVVKSIAISDSPDSIQPTGWPTATTPALSDSFISVAGSIYLAAGTKLYVNMFAATTFHARLQAFSIVRNGTGPAGPSGQSAGKIFYHATSDPSDIAGYKTLLPSPSTGAEQTIASVCSGTADVLVATFATDPGIPGAVDYPAGTAYRRFYAMTSAGVARLHLQILKRDAAGVETLIRDEFSDPFTDTSVAVQMWTATASSAGALLATDRIVARLYAQRVSGPTNITVTTFYEGVSHASQIQTTISTGTQGPKGDKGDTPSVGAAAGRFSSAQADVGGGVWKNLPLISQLVEPVDAFTIVGGALQIKDAGWYRISANVGNPSGAAALMYFAISTSATPNEGDIANGQLSGMAYGRGSCSGNGYFAAGTKIYLHAYSPNVSPVLANVTYNEFGIERIGGPQGPGGTATIPLDKWHPVNSAGEPALNSGYTMLDPVLFQKDPLGKVHLRGSFATCGPSGNVAFTLPAGYIPSVRYRAISIGSQTATGQWEAQVNVLTDGTVVIYYTGPGSSAFVSLDQITFDSDTVTAMPTGPKGDTGATGPAGTGTIAKPLAGQIVGDTGQTSQIRAGRQLSVADFTSLGLSAPIGLYNLSNANDSSGNGYTLSNKGALSFNQQGVNGLPSTATVLSGLTTQALYIADTGAADPFRIKTGSWGCWFKTARRGVSQHVMAKGAASPQRGWRMAVGGTSVLSVAVSSDGTAEPATASGTSDVCDERWHFAVATHDGTGLRLYIDGALEATAPYGGVIFGSSGPLNIGAIFADAAIAATEPFFGRIDEAFVTADVLSEDQVRCLYAVKISHTLGVVPAGAVLNVNRYSRGGTLVVGDFPATPRRLHNFTAGVLTDEGLNAVALANAYSSLIVPVAGADGAFGNAYSFSGVHQGLTADDTTLIPGLTTRSYGCWLKTISLVAQNVMAWGQIPGTNDARLSTSGGSIAANNGADVTVGPSVADGRWHHVVVVENNGPADGVKRRMYVDGRVVASSLVMNSIVTGGANFFRVGAGSTGVAPFTGQIDGVFVTSGGLTPSDVAKLYAKGSQALGVSPKNSGDHIERMTTTDLYFIGDTLETQQTVDLGVIA